MHALQRVYLWCVQVVGRLSDAVADVLAKAAKCLPRHYHPVDGTVAYAAAGDEVQFIFLDLEGKVRYLPVSLKSAVTLPEDAHQH